MIKNLFLLFIMIILFSCTKSNGLSVQEQYDQDIAEIEKYISVKGWGAQKTIEGIYYVIDVPGTIEKPVITSRVNVGYVGRFLDDITFDASENATFPLSGVIQGWQIGIPKFGKGGKGKILIPSSYAYGQGNIKGRTNAPLVFEVELKDFN